MPARDESVWTSGSVREGKPRRRKERKEKHDEMKRAENRDGYQFGMNYPTFRDTPYR